MKSRVEMKSRASHSKSTIPHSDILHCTALYCTVLRCTTLYIFALPCPALLHIASNDHTVQ